MAAIEPLCGLIDIQLSVFSKEEQLFLEVELFARICEEVKEVFRKRYKEYFRLINFTIEKENNMLETHFVSLIIKDILSTDEYTLAGIARYTDTHEDVIEEIFLERNTNPSAFFLRRLIELHRTIRRNLYLSIMKKIVTEHSKLESIPS